GLGIVASIGSAVTGVTDWQHTHEEDRRVGLVHGVVNLVATALYAMSWWDRRHGRGIALTALGYGITVGGSYLGGRWCSSPASESTSRVSGCAPKSGLPCCRRAR